MVKLIICLKIWEENLVKILKQFLKSQQINNKSYGTNPTASNAEYKPVFQWTISDRLFDINLFYEIMIILVNVRILICLLYKRTWVVEEPNHTATRKLSPLYIILYYLIPGFLLYALFFISWCSHTRPREQYKSPSLLFVGGALPPLYH